MKNMKKLTSLLLALLLLVQVVPTAVLADDAIEPATQEIVVTDAVTDEPTTEVTEEPTDEPTEEIEDTSVPELAEQQLQESEISLALEGENEGEGEAATSEITVYVTISNAGELVMKRQAVTLTGKSTYNIDDALRAAHKDAGKTDDYNSSYTDEYGLSLEKLWGDSGNFGYYVNNALAWSLADSVVNGDEIYAFVYKTGWSDAYTYFDTTVASTSTGSDLTVRLKYVSDYDSTTYAPIFSPLSGATITIDDVSTEVKTDKNGEATVTLPKKEGRYTISATHDSMTIVPPVCDAAVAYVTISNAGTLVMKRRPVVLTDAHNIDEALRAAHKAAGKEDDYSSYTGEYGLSLGMLWGDSSGCFGYHVNNASAWSLADSVVNGDEIYAFVYSDKTGWSDAYTYFDRTAVNTAAGSKLTLTLKYVSYDPETYAPIFSPLSGAAITIDDESSGVTTDANGKAVVTLPGEEGTYTISATHDSMTIVPPVCVVTAKPGVSTSPLGSSTTLYDTEGNQTVFDPSVTGYNVTLKPGTGSVTLAKVPSGYTAKYTLDEGAQTSLSASTKVNISAGEHTLTVTYTSDASGEESAYNFRITRTTALKTLNVKRGTSVITLNPAFKNTSYLDTDYAGTYKLVTGEEKLTLALAAYDTANTTVLVNGDALNSDGYALTEGENKFTITTAPTGGSVERTYIVTITACEAKAVTVNVPAGAQLSVTDPNGSTLALPTPTSNSFCDSYALSGLFGGQTYSYAVGKYGFTSKSGTFVPGTDETVDIVLNTSGTGFVDENADWKNFRNSDVNMAITDAELPTTGETAKLKWVTSESFKTGSGMSTFNPAGMVMDDGYIYTTKGNTVVKLDRETGEIAASGEIAANGVGALGCVALCLGDGKVFVPLTDGRIQALDAQTLKSVWISESLGTQCTVSPIYKDGYLYGATGQSAPAAVFCINVRDEDTQSTNETKYATWTLDTSAFKGSYWSTPVIVGNALIIGTDISASATTIGELSVAKGKSVLLSINRENGNVISALELDGKNQRSSIVYSDGKVWFMTKSGTLYSVDVASDTGVLSNKHSFANSYTDSTATPIIHDGVVYIQATKKIDKKTSYCFAAVDADEMTLIAEKQLETTGALQSSPILSTAFEESGKLYFYFTQNAKPGALYAACYDTNAKTFTFETIYTPDADKQEYCIVSPVCDDEGTIYYRNDSGYIFAMENLVGIGLDRENVVLSVGESYPLTATVVTTGSSALTYGSSDPAVATVDASGKITAVAPGEAKITVKTGDNRYSAECKVTVKSTTILYSENSTAFVSEPTGTLPSGATLTHKQKRGDNDRTVLKAEKALKKLEELEGRVYSVDELSIETVTGGEFTVTAPLTAGVAMSKTYLNSSSYKPVAAVLNGTSLTFLDTEVSGNYATFSPVTDLDATYVMLLLTDDSAREALNNTEDTTDYDAIIDKINSADEGDTIRLNITSSSKIPWTVFDALENAEKNVTLNIVSKKYQWKFVSDDVDVPDNASGTFDPWVRLLEQEDTADKSFEGQKYLSVTFRDTEQEIPGRSTLIFSTSDTALSSADDCTLYGITGDGDVTDAAGRFLFDDGDCAMTVTTTRQYVVLAADGKTATAAKKDETAEAASAGSTAGTGSGTSSLAPAPITQAEKDTNRELEEERKEPVVTLDLSEYEAFMKEAVENQQTLSDALEEAKTSYADAVSTLKSEKQSAVIKTAVISVLGTSAVWALILLGAKKKKNGEDEGK